jgi:hypothetical protein
MFLSEAAQSVWTCPALGRAILIKFLQISWLIRVDLNDYNRYPRVTNDPGWSWQNILKYIRMVHHYFSVQLSHTKLKYYVARKVRATTMAIKASLLSPSLDFLMPEMIWS